MQNRMKEHQLNEGQMKEILKKAAVGNFATIDEKGFPYVVPVHFVYYEEKIYIHGLPKGQKINNLNANEKVGFGINEMKSLIMGQNACDVNTEYESIIITGTAKLVTDYISKETILGKIVDKYTPIFSQSKLPENMIKGTGIIEIRVLSCTGKYYK